MFAASDQPPKLREAGEVRQVEEIDRSPSSPAPQSFGPPQLGGPGSRLISASASLAATICLPTARTSRRARAHRHVSRPGGAPVAVGEENFDDPVRANGT